MSITHPRALRSPSLAAREWRGGFTSRPVCILDDHCAQAWQQPRNDLVQPPHRFLPQVRPENRTRRFRHGVLSIRLLGTIVQGLPRH